MDRTIRKAFLLGLGITLLSKEKVEKEMKKFMKTHSLSEAASRDMAQKAIAESIKHKKALEKHIQAMETEFKKHGEKAARRAAKKVIKKGRKAATKAYKQGKQMV